VACRTAHTLRILWHWAERDLTGIGWPQCPDVQAMDCSSWAASALRAKCSNLMSMGAGDVVRVTPAELVATANLIGQSATDFNTDVQRLSIEVRAVVGGSRQGGAGSTDGDAWTDWFTAAGRSDRRVGGDAVLLRGAATGYAGTDTDSADALDGISGGPGSQS